MKSRLMSLGIVFSLALMMTSFSFADVLYPDIYGVGGLKKIDEKIRDKILVIYLDEAYADPNNSNKDFEYKSLLSAKKRIIQLAEEFKSYENLCMLMVFTHENSILPKVLPVDKGGSVLKGASLNINKVDSNTWKILRKDNRGAMPVAIIDYEPGYNIEWDPTKGFEQQFLPRDGSMMLRNIKSAIGRRVSDAIKEAENAIKEPKEGNDPEVFYREAKSLLKNVSNPHYIFTCHEFHEYCRNLVKSYINIAVKGTLQKNPAEVDLNEIIAENQTMMSAGECLKMSLNYMNRNREPCPDIKGVTELFNSGLTSESKGEFEEARSQYQQALILDSGWEEIRISLIRVKEKIQRVLLCIQQEIMFYDELSEKEISHFPNYYQQILAQDLSDKGYRVIIPIQKKGIYEQLEMLQPGKHKPQDSQDDIEHTSGRVIYGKTILTVRKFDVSPFVDFDLKLIVVEGNIQLSFMKLGGTGTSEIVKSFNLDKLDRGIGKTAFKAAEDFFDQNEAILKTELERFLGEIGKPE